jgi:hypothetical protein
VARKIALFIQFLLLYSIFQTAYKPSPAEKDTHSVQNPNAKVSIILTVFNKFNTEHWERLNQSIDRGEQFGGSGVFSGRCFG